MLVLFRLGAPPPGAQLEVQRQDAALQVSSGNLVVVGVDVRQVGGDGAGQRGCGERDRDDEAASERTELHV